MASCDFEIFSGVSSYHEYTKPVTNFPQPQGNNNSVNHGDSSGPKDNENLHRETSAVTDAPYMIFRTQGMRIRCNFHLQIFSFYISISFYVSFKSVCILSYPVLWVIFKETI